MEYKNMNITIDVTSKCNLRCKHCRVNEIGYDMTLDEIEEVFNKLTDFKPRGVFISGGEPLIRDDIVEIVKKSKKLAPVTILNTNSLLLTENKLKELVDSGLNYMQVSVDGIEEQHDYIRGKGTYKKTIEKMKMINEYSDQIKLHISSVVSQKNIDYMEEFARQILEIEKINVQILGFKRFIPNNVLKDTAALGKDGLKKLYKNLELLQKKYNEKTTIVSDMPMKNVFNEKRAIEVMKKYNLSCVGCSAGVNGISIRNDGTVTPCTLLYISCGNILKQNLKEILQNADMVKIKNRELKGKCGKCQYKLICGGCRAAAYQISGDFLEEDSECFI